MRRIIGSAVALLGLLSLPAAAEQPSPPLTPQLALPQIGGQLQEDWVALNTQLGHVGERMTTYVQEAQRQAAQATQLAAELKAVKEYWKGWCGPAAGCAVGLAPKPPVAEAKPPQ